MDYLDFMDDDQTRIFAEDPLRYPLFAILAASPTLLTHFTDWLSIVLVAITSALLLCLLKHSLVVDSYNRCLWRERRLGSHLWRKCLVRFDSLSGFAVDPQLGNHLNPKRYDLRVIRLDGSSFSFRPQTDIDILEIADLIARTLAEITGARSWEMERVTGFLKVRGRGENQTISYSESWTHWALHHHLALLGLVSLPVAMLSILFTM